MSDPSPFAQERMHRAVLVLMALLISALFLWMIKEFLLALLLAAILSGWSYPLYEKIRARVGQRPVLGSALTVLVMFLLVIIPLIGFFIIVGVQTLELAREARPWVIEQLEKTSQLNETVTQTRLWGLIEPYRDDILAKVGTLASEAGTLAIAAVSAAARSTVQFFFMLFVMLYAMFFFLIDGRTALEKILFYLPLPTSEEDRMIGRFVSVARATIKGTVVIGAAQGALAGLGFWVVGIEGAAVWATIMAVLSAIPGLGPMLVWVPAVIYLAAAGSWAKALGLFAWCALVVGTVDNVLRPRLVGQDTQLPDLLILLSTLGGLVLFGATGIIVGPIVAALFVTVWDLYGAAFADVLPARGPLPDTLPAAAEDAADPEPPA